MSLYSDDATDKDEEKLGAFYSELCKTLKSLVTSKSGLVCNICESVASLARIGKDRLSTKNFKILSEGVKICMCKKRKKLED